MHDKILFKRKRRQRYSLSVRGDISRDTTIYGFYLTPATWSRNPIIHRKLVETLTLIMDDWSDCAKSDIGMRVTMHKAKLSDRITNSILILHTMSIFVYCLGVIMADVDVTDQTIELPFVNKLKLPFNINMQSTYRFILIVEFVHMIFCNWLLGIVNAILLTLVSCNHVNNCEKQYIV